MELRALLYPLICDYLQELQRIAGKPELSAQQLHDEIDGLFAVEIFDWTPVYGSDQNTLIGFICISKAPISKKIGYYFGEAYIIPSERRKGYMRQELQKQISVRKIDALAYALQMKNKVAKDFWDNCLHELGFVEVTRSISFPMLGDMDMHHWERRTRTA